jgi:hypothetical protein
MRETGGPDTEKVETAFYKVVPGPLGAVMFALAQISRYARESGIAKARRRAERVAARPEKTRGGSERTFARGRSQSVPGLKDIIREEHRQTRLPCGIYSMERAKGPELEEAPPLSRDKAAL